MKYIYLLVTVFIILATFYGSQAYSGATYIYVIFSFSSFLMLAVCLLQKQYFGPIFISVFLWMGFWFKSTLYFFTQKSFVEPVGRFNFTVESWDEVLVVAAVGMSGLTFSILGFRILNNKKILFRNLKLPAVGEIPDFYTNHRFKIYLISYAIAVIIPLINMRLGIHQIGLNPRTILSWPLNAVISFAINIGLMLLCSVYLFWDIKKEKGIFLGISLTVLTALLASISALSRGMFILQLMPIFIALMINRKSNFKFFMGGVLTLTIFLILSISIITILRNKFYPNVNIMTSGQEFLIRLEVIEGGIGRVKELIKRAEKSDGSSDSIRSNSLHLDALTEEKKQLTEKLEHYKINRPDPDEEVISKKISIFKKNMNIGWSEMLFQIKYEAVKNILNLAFNRFIGVEGVMAMQSFNSKGWDVFIDAILEKRLSAKHGMYQEVAMSTYRNTDMKVWQFASLPGAIAFLYYSGSLVAVFLGMFIFGVILIYVEKCVFFLSSGNIFLISLIMSSVSSSIAQFGLAPRQDLPYYSMIFMSIIAYWFTVRLLNKKADVNNLNRSCSLI